ncbi:MAG: RIP metalloprotease RseP [Clostridia bacterium]|nr:RIP metalloprotease RseP [Clostridia bacterium]
MEFNLLLSFSEIAVKALPIIIAVLFFGLIIFIHELGHFIFAKAFGVKVNEFALGMGPTILKKQGKETKYALRLFPIGGFVSMEGEDEASDDSRAYCNQKAWKRMIIISAGAVMNLILGVVVCFCLVCSEDLVGTNQILQFYEGSVSSSSLKEGDKIVRIDGKRVFSDYDISFLMQRNATGHYDFIVERDGEKIELEDVPFAKRTMGNFSYSPDCSISSVSAKLKKVGFEDGDIITSVNGVETPDDKTLIAQIQADEDYVYDFTVKRGGEELSFEQITLQTATVFDFIILGEDKNILNVTKNAFGYAFSMGRMVYLSLFDLLSGQYGLNELTGAVGTISVITDIAEESVATTDWSQLFMLMAMITINIGLFNLLPVPALDGGHLFFMFVELIIRRPIPQKYVSWIHAAGLVLLLGLMAVITFSDIWKLISGVGFY